MHHNLASTVSPVISNGLITHICLGVTPKFIHEAYIGCTHKRD